MSRPEFTKQDLFTDVVVDFDDFCDDYEKSGLQYLYYIKSKFPKFKVTLFAVPNWKGENQRSFYEEIKKLGWIQLAVHGWQHPHPRECQDWDVITTERVLDEVESWGVFEKIWKSPGWQISNDTYSVLVKRGYIVGDQHYNKDRRPADLQAYCTCHPLMCHGHTWDMENDNPLYRNGLRQFIEEHGLPFDKDTNFNFITETELTCK